MWELYTLWVLAPLILATRFEGTQLSMAAFSVIGVGALGCILGGLGAKRWGQRQSGHPSIGHQWNVLFARTLAHVCAP
jgi:hypothetical protein